MQRESRREDRGVAPAAETCALGDGRTLAYAVGGDESGTPVVAHHGTPGSRLFASLLDDAAAEAGVRLLVPDRPGYGRSSPPPDDWGWREWRRDLAALLDAESVERCGVVGFSGGGPFALAAGGSDRVSRVGLVSSVVPPAEVALVRLSRVPFAVRALFRLSGAFASVAGPDTVVGQYTDRSVPEAVSRAVADDFHEALRQGATAVARENRSFGSEWAGIDRTPVPVRAWHGTRDGNAPLSAVEALAGEREATLTTAETDHLGTLLDYRCEVLQWVGDA
ncbi:alpha/beta fold hydrolase [Halorubrum yunnanense]|uniref:Alpha/beta fold hydrolase n=1 Tax=Halorubrum yunnanense TaxID=1526162 RepID=A0ABD5YFG9_9EURY|nr:alpha/beta hydrolase [Halorubrum yunnanense]